MSDKSGMVTAAAQHTGFEDLPDVYIIRCTVFLPRMPYEHDAYTLTNNCNVIPLDKLFSCES